MYWILHSLFGLRLCIAASFFSTFTRCSACYRRQHCQRRSVEVESDEDIEVQFEGRRIYVQVKHRKKLLAWNDIEGAITRFGELRDAHGRV